MARYFFHIRDHVDRLLDPDGVEVPDPAALPALALREARALVAAEALDGVINLAQYIEVEDADGKAVHQLGFSDAVKFINSLPN